MAFTYFFRDMQTLNLIKEYALPELKTRRFINIWDAGCANGPEPYSLAIIFRENMSHFIFRNMKIYATDYDVSNRFDKIIKEGIYAEEEVKRIPRNVFDKYFSPDGRPGHFKISDEIIRSVTFQRHDLLSLQPVREGVSLILCKNVLLHFKEEEKIKVIKMFHNALSEGGFFVTEQTQKMPKDTAPLFKQVTAQGQIFRKVR